MGTLEAEIGIARRVGHAIREAGSDVHSVAQAADMTDLDLIDRLNGCVAFGLEDLRRVGGFLHVPATQFMEVAA